MTGQSRTIEAGLDGQEGRITACSSDVSLHGKWASHTGFRCKVNQTESVLDDEALRTIAWNNYAEESQYAFAVGDEHREEGWKKVAVDYQGRIQLRLPDWHEGIVSATLERYGMTNTCPHNRYWTFAADSGVTAATVRAVFAPILQPGTRLACEQTMSDAIDRCAMSNAFLVGTPLYAGAMQAELF